RSYAAKSSSICCGTTVFESANSVASSRNENASIDRILKSRMLALNARVPSVYEIRWDEKSRSPERDAISSQVIHALEAQENKETGMKKISTTTAKAFRKMEKLTIGLDLGDRSSCYCVLDERGELVLEQKVSTTPKAMEEVFGGMPRSRIALETG